MVYTLRARCDVPAYEYQTDLDGRTFTLSFEWTERSQSWHISIFDQDGEPLLLGIRLTTGQGVLSRYADPRLPEGEIMCVDTGPDNKDPGRDDFGSRVVLQYFDAAEVADAT